MKIHPIFHMSILESYKIENIPRRRQVLPLPIKVNNNEEFKVGEVLESRQWKNKL